MFQKIKNIFQFKSRKTTIALYIILPLVLNLIIEMLGRKSVSKGFVYMISHPFGFLCNASIIFFTLTLSLLFRRRLFALVFTSVIWLILGFVNYFLLSSRVTPFTAMDFLLIDSALAVINKYFTTVTYIVLGVAIAAIVAGLVILFIKVPKIKGKMNYGKKFALVILSGVFMFVMLLIGNLTHGLSLKFPELSQAYLKYGFAYCFSNSVFNSGVTKPGNYSKEQIDKITKEEETDSKKSKSGLEEDSPYMDASIKVKTPNIIIVQLESFFDITRCIDMDFSEDPLPNYHKYMKKCASGHLSMPVVGAGTVNSEFEVLTGLNIDNFGPGEYPYKTTLRTKNCESICYNLAPHGYTSHAVHNNTGGFYGRNIVFSQLGFHDFTSVEYLNLNPETDYTPMGWAKDYCLTNVVKQALDSTKGSDFVYTISVQGHGSYPTSGDYDFPIKVTSKQGYQIDQSLLNSREYYTNQIHEMDQFVGQLIDEIKKRDEESIVVFYGDHLPSLDFEESEFGKGETVYQTEYFIWENVKGVSYEKKDMEAFQLEADILKPLGITDGFVNKYHQEKENSKDYLNGLANLQYDIFKGDKVLYGGTNPYKPTNLQMGINKIEITSIYKQTKSNTPETIQETTQASTSEPAADAENITPKAEETPPVDSDGYVIIKGKNFTKYSKVFVNNEYFGNTEFIDSETLRIYYPQLRGLDSFVVSQAHSDSSILSSTKEVLYYGDASDATETTTGSETTK